MAALAPGRGYGDSGQCGWADKMKNIGEYQPWINAAVKTLPAPGTQGPITFRDPPKQEPRGSWAEGDVRHQTELAKIREPPPQVRAEASAPAPQYTKEQLKEWAYPEYDPNFDNPEWLREQFRKEREDPRENANFWLTEEDPEFWDNVARRPYARALLRSEEHWRMRKNTWLQQFQSVQELNKYRAENVERLESCSMEMRRLCLPMMKYKIVELYLMQIAKQSVERGVPFAQLIETAENRRQLLQFRATADIDGEKGATDLFLAWDAQNVRYNADEKEKEERQQRPPTSVLELNEALAFGLKCKKDGVLEWEKGNHEEALRSWREGHKTLRKLIVPATHPVERQQLDEVHIAVLKNLSQAAIKLGHWNEGLEAAENALKIDDEDHKAWFRRACALEGLGRLDEIEECLQRIDEISVGRSDQERLQKDTQTKREKVQELKILEEATQKRMFERGMEKSLWSEQRSRTNNLPLRAKVPGPPAISQKVKVKPLDEGKRKRLTRDGVEDMLKDLSEAYKDSTFRGQVRKLARDVHDQAEFLCYLGKVALSVQKPVLEKWGFEASEYGVNEMTRAIQDHTRGKDPDLELRAQAEMTMRDLYGEFYDIARAPGLRPEERAPKPAAKKRPKVKGVDFSDSESEKEDIDKICSHWTGRITSKDEDRWTRPAAKSAESGEGASAPSRPASGSAKREVPVDEPDEGPPLDRKEAWAQLTKAMGGLDANVLRRAIRRAIASGFSQTSVKAAKKRLTELGGSVEGL